MKDFRHKGLYGRLSLNDKLSDEIVIICHGFGSSQNSSTIQLIRSWAVNRNKSVLTFDFSGHGDSKGDFEDLTISGSVTDVNNIIDYATKQLKFKKITLIGYSYGGLVAAAVTMDRFEVANLVLINSLPDYHEKEMLLNHTKELEDWAETGVREYVIHDKVLKLNYAHYEDSLNYSAYNLLKNTNANIFLIHSINDEMVPYKQAVKLSNEIGIPLYTIKDGQHRFTKNKSKSDLLNYLDIFLS